MQQSAIVSKETEESVSVHLMKATADNPHDEHLLSEIGAYREVFSELWGKAAADQNLDAAGWADKCKLNLLSHEKCISSVAVKHVKTMVGGRQRRGQRLSDKNKACFRYWTSSGGSFHMQTLTQQFILFFFWWPWRAAHPPDIKQLQDEEIDASIGRWEESSLYFMDSNGK